MRRNTEYPNTRELLCQFGKRWSVLSKAEQEQIIAEWIAEEPDIVDYLIYCPVFCKLGMVIKGALSKGDFIQEIIDYILRAHADKFYYLADQALLENQIAYEERLAYNCKGVWGDSI